MRLLDTETQELTFFPESGRPPYAILSHTWGDDEVPFTDFVDQKQAWRQKAGANKVLGSCQLAREKGYKHIWIDSCCIDKSSSAELSEAINSMFNWYMDAEVCYVYLTDVAKDGSIAECRWFKRGWTLQELIAPTSVNFYDKDWQFINDKISMSSDLARITGIDEPLLRDGHSLNPPLLKDHHMQEVTVEWSGKDCEKMSWASTRETTRGEDIAYCLMGLFRVNMPLLYGEGSSKAFFRLQKEILETTHDQSILAIDSPSSDFFVRDFATQPALASHPRQFSYCGVVDFKPYYSAWRKIEEDNKYDVTTRLSKDGVIVDLLLVPDASNHALFYGILDFQIGTHPLGRLAIPLHRVMTSGTSSKSFRRAEGLFEISPAHLNRAKQLEVSSGLLPFTIFPYRQIQMEAVKREEVIILHKSDHTRNRIHRKGLPAPIRCTSSGPDCAAYSVESAIPGYAILGTPGRPRLLIHTMESSQVDEWHSRIWVLKDINLNHGAVLVDAGDTRQILAKIMKNYSICYDETLGRMSLIDANGVYYPGSEALIVHGFSRLEVKVSVRPVQFLDWTMPEVTVATTNMDSSKTKRQS